MLPVLAILTTVVLVFPPMAKVSGEIYLAPDGNYVGLLELGGGKLLRLMDGWKGRGPWCGELLSEGDPQVVCGTGRILQHSAGLRVRMYGPGVAVDDVAVKGGL